MLSTDAQSVMNTSLKGEYIQAKVILDQFRGDPAKGIEPEGKMRVSRDAYAQARPGVDVSAMTPPFELGYNELPAEMKINVDTAFERMLADAANRHQDVLHGDQADHTRARPVEER